MRTTLMIIGFITGILALVMNYLPFGTLGFAPVLLTMLMAILVWKMARKENRGVVASKILMGLAVLSLALAVYQSAFNENIVEEDAETIQKEEESLEDAKKELEDLEIDE
ncbi:MAG: hypothetical protein HKN00_12685 [Flavobacteriaceae bacterium]|nr:hypothetical protein [Bacteroidia bacterium]MBT8288223.1 hypothetical protein [Bacteroidia bacterium]NNF76039.1 hypothetical protein [Flavobacteriaceae bacterium]NNK73167.1 hypothetical protein [Flavobacteriaceae bacterium]